MIFKEIPSMFYISKASQLRKASTATLLAFSAVVSVVVLAASVDPTWRSKPMDKWSAQDAKQILTNSPWAKMTTVKAYVPQSEDQLRQAGRMGGGQGIGLQGLDPKGFLLGSSTKRNRPDSAMVNELQVRWESAEPVRAAEVKLPNESAPDNWKGEYYAIAVYGVPIPPEELSNETNNWNLKKLAVLKREGKKDLKPIKTDVSVQSEKLSIVVYFFPRSAAITADEGPVKFDARIGRLMLDQTFDTKEMLLGDKLQL
jgi:hypothetical protein